MPTINMENEFQALVMIELNFFVVVLHKLVRTQSKICNCMRDMDCAFPEAQHSKLLSVYTCFHMFWASSSLN